MLLVMIPSPTPLGKHKRRTHDVTRKLVPDSDSLVYRSIMASPECYSPHQSNHINTFCSGNRDSLIPSWQKIYYPVSVIWNSNISEHHSEDDVVHSEWFYANSFATLALTVTNKQISRIHIDTDATSAQTYAFMFKTCTRIYRRHCLAITPARVV